MKNKKRKKKLSLRKKIALFLLVFLLLGAAGVYGYTVYYFTGHFYNGSKVNGLDSSYKTVEEVKREIVDEINKYTLTIQEAGEKEETITARDIGLEYIDDNKIDQLMADQKPFLWFLSLGNDKNFEMAANTSYNEETINDIIGQLDCFQEENIEAPQNAYIQENEVDFEIIPEVEGNKLDYDKVKGLVTAAIKEGKTEISLEEESCYLKPEIYQDNEELTARLGLLNQLAATSVTFDFGDDRTEVINWAILKTWIPKDDDGNYVMTDGQFAVDQNLVQTCIEQFADKYDTYGKERKFKNFFGEKVTLTKGSYGWKLDQEQMINELYTALMENQVVAKEAIYSKTAKSHSNSDVGSTYVEISIENQRMWFYKDGELLVDTPVVTGNPSKNWDTPKGGIWPVAWKASPYTLKGEVQPDGTREYEEPVTYWIPFNGGVGIHDLPGRTEFGGEIYKTNGSHGCVNTPLDAVEKIYQNVQSGTPVVVY